MPAGEFCVRARRGDSRACCLGQPAIVPAGRCLVRGLCSLQSHLANLIFSFTAFVLVHSNSIDVYHYQKICVYRVPSCLPCAAFRAHGKHIVCRVPIKKHTAKLLPCVIDQGTRQTMYLPCVLLYNTRQTKFPLARTPHLARPNTPSP